MSWKQYTLSTRLPVSLVSGTVLCWPRGILFPSFRTPRSPLTPGHVCDAVRHPRDWLLDLVCLANRSLPSLPSRLLSLWNAARPNDPDVLLPVLEVPRGPSTFWTSLLAEASALDLAQAPSRAFVILTRLLCPRALCLALKAPCL